VLKANKSLHYDKVEYQAWKYQETPASWAYLYEVLTYGYLNADESARWKWWSRQTRLLRLNLKRNSIWKNLVYVFAAIFMVFIPLIAAEIATVMDIPVVYLVFGAITLDLTWLVTLKAKWAPKAKDVIRKFADKHSFKQLLGFQAEIQKEIAILFKAWIGDKAIGKKRIVLFVEDIDRCTEDRILQNVDALRLVLEDNDLSKRLIIVIAVDERILKDAIRGKYKKSESVYAPTSRLVTEYLDKLFLFAIKLGELSGIQKEEFLKELFRNETDKDSWTIDQNSLSETIPGAPLSTTLSYSGSSSPPSSAAARLQDNAAQTEVKEPVVEAVQIASESEKAVEISDRLTRHEVKTFRQLVAEWHDITPRQLRIFYYRYLLLKHLLLKYYETLPNGNPWTTAPAVSALLIFLRRYSGHEGQETLVEDKKLVNAHTSDAFIPLISSHSDQTFQGKHMLILFECIDLVVAY
jgi:hypothetical protein